MKGYAVLLIVILVLDLVCISFSLYIHYFKHYVCILTDIVSTQCEYYNTTKYTKYYIYSIVGNALINNITTTDVTGVCDDYYNHDCTECILKITVGSTYKCWLDSINNHYKFYIDYSPYYNEYVVSVIFSILFTFALACVGAKIIFLSNTCFSHLQNDVQEKEEDYLL